MELPRCGAWRLTGLAQWLKTSAGHWLRRGLPEAATNEPTLPNPNAGMLT
jgi:hypothetical protein